MLNAWSNIIDTELEIICLADDISKKTCHRLEQSDLNNPAQCLTPEELMTNLWFRTRQLFQIFPEHTAFVDIGKNVSDCTLQPVFMTRDSILIILWSYLLKSIHLNPGPSECEKAITSSIYDMILTICIRRLKYTLKVWIFPCQLI